MGGGHLRLDFGELFLATDIKESQNNILMQYEREIQEIRH